MINGNENGCGGLKRFIRYLYEYQDGQRVRNVGFVKVEQGQEQTVIHIHGKGLRLEGDRKLLLYLILDKGSECMTLYQGEIENVNPAVNYRLTYEKGDVGTPENYEQIDGLLMENNEHKKFAVVWDDMSVDVDNLRPWKTNCEDNTQTEEKPVQEEIAKKEDERKEDETKEDKTKEETVTEEEQESCEEAIASGRKYTKIKRQELSGLARKEWRLANNSFLLHGYYNYHHLLLIEEEGHMWLGVPGVYHEKEAHAAEAFGFAQFTRISENEMRWKQGEKNSVDDFGYWCRQVRT